MSPGRVDPRYISNEVKAGYLRYDVLVEWALMEAIKSALLQVEDVGLFGQHALFITFDAAHTGVKYPAHLPVEENGETTIVIDQQFYGLEIHDDGFYVSLIFNDAAERIFVPFNSIKTFADSGVNFALQFNVKFEERSQEGEPGKPTISAAPTPSWQIDFDA